MTLTTNQRVTITIDPWAFSATDGSELSNSYVGQWHTPLDPMYSHKDLVMGLGGKVVQDMPIMLIN